MATISDIYRKAVDSGVLSNKVSEERFAQMLQNDNERKAYWEYANQKKPGFYSSDYNMFSQNASALLSAKPAQQFNEPTDLSGVQNQADSQNMQDGNQAPSIQNQHTTPAGFRTVDTSQPVLDPNAGQREVFMMGEPDEQRRQQLEAYERKRAANMPQMEQMWANDAKRFDEIMAEAEAQGAQAAGQVAAEYGNAYQYTGMPGGTRLAVRGEMQAAANKETDPDKIAGQMMDEILARYEKQQEIETKRLIREGLSAKEENANLSEDELNQLVNQTYDNIKSQPIEQLQQEAGVDDSDMAIYAEYVQEQMRNRFMDKYTPQDNWEYFARKVAEGNLLGQAVGAMIETPAQRAYKMQGTQRYASGHNTTWLDLGAEATNIVTDPTMYFFPAAGHAAANFGVRKLATSALTRKGIPYAAQVAERQLLQRGSWNAASRLLGGSLGFMGIDVAHDIAGQMYMPVYNEKTGKYEEGAYDAMQTVGAAGKGAVMGAAFGLGGLMGDAVQRSVGQAYGKTIGAVAGKGTHYAMGTNLMFGSDVMSQIAQGTPIEDIDFGEAYRHAAMTQLFFDLWGGAKQFSANRNIRQKDGSVQHLSFRDAVRLGWNQTKDPYPERFTFTNEELEQLNKYINGGNNQEILLNLNSKGRTGNEDWLNDFYKQLNAVFTDPEVDTQTKYKLAYLLSGEDVRGNVRPIHVGGVEDIGGGKYQVRTYDNSAQTYSTRRFNSFADARRYEAEQQDITKTNKMYWLEGIAATYGFAKAFDGLTSETIEKTMQNYPQLTEADARRILTTAKEELSPVERAIKGRMESYLSKEVKGQEFVKFLRQELAIKNGISEQAVNNILSKEYSELNSVEKAIFDDYLDRLTQEIPLEKEVREQKRAIEAGGGIPAEPVEPTQPTREDVIRQEVTEQVASQTHKNGYVYPVKQAGADGKAGYIVGGEVVVDTTDPTKPRISNDDIVTVKYEDGTVEQVSARTLDLVSAPDLVDNVIAGMVEQRLAAEAQQEVVEQAVAQNLPEGVVEFTNGQQILLAKDNGDGTYVVLDEQGNPQSEPMPLQDYIDSGYRPKAPAQPVQPEPAQPVAPQEPAQPIQPVQPAQPAQPAEPIQPEPQAPDVNSNATPEEFAAQMTEYMGSPRIARGFLLAEQKKIETQLKKIEEGGVKDYTDAADYRTKAQQLEQTRQALQTQLDKINSSIAVIEQQEQAAEQAAQAQAEAEAAAKAEAERLAAEQKAAEEQRLAAEQQQEQPEAQVEQTPTEKPETTETPKEETPTIGILAGKDELKKLLTFKSPEEERFYDNICQSLKDDRKYPIAAPLEALATVRLYAERGEVEAEDANAAIQEIDQAIEEVKDMLGHNKIPADNYTKAWEKAMSIFEKYPAKKEQPMGIDQQTDAAPTKEQTQESAAPAQPQGEQTPLDEFGKRLQEQGQIEGKVQQPKINSRKWVSAKNDPREALKGVYNDPSGVGVATNAHIMVVSPSLYDRAKDGLSIKPDGSVADGTFPQWESVVNGAQKRDRLQALVDWDHMRRFLAGCRVQMKQNGASQAAIDNAKVVIRMPNGDLMAYRMWLFSPFADAAATFGSDVLHYSDAGPEIHVQQGRNFALALGLSNPSDGENDGSYQFYYDIPEEPAITEYGETPMFSIGTQAVKVDDQTLVGIHNLSEEKLRKAMKMGGLANPSTAVINIATQSHEDYGAISLIMPSRLVDSDTGRNAGTFTGDIWSPTYPHVEKQMSDKGDDAYYAAITKAFGNNEARRPILSRAKLDFDDYLDSGNIRAGLAYWYLLEKGIEPGDVYFNSGISDDIKERFRPLYDKGILDLTKEDYRTLLSLIAEQQGKTAEDMLQDAQESKARYQQTIDDPEAKQFYKKIAQQAIDEIDLYGVRYNVLSNGYHAMERAIRNDGKIDLDSTLIAAQDIVQTQYQAYFDKWISDFDERFDISEVLFQDYDRDGNRIYKPHTLANVSRMMNKEELQNAGDHGGLGATRGILVKRLETLADIRAEKGRLRPGTEEDIETEEWNKMQDEWFEKVLNPLSDMQKISDNPFSNVGYAETRLQEALRTKNPIAHLNKEYGYHIAKDSQWAKDLADMVERVKNLPTKYFETKFRRPVYLNEFAAAVVPNDLSQDLRDGLQKSGLKIFEYDPKSQESRREATLRATEDEGIRFAMGMSGYDADNLTPEQQLVTDAVMEVLKENKSIGVNIATREDVEAVLKAQRVQRKVSVPDKILQLFNEAKAGKLKGKSIRIGGLTEEGRKYLESLSGLKLKDKIDFRLNPSDLVHIYNEHFGENEKDPGNNIPLNDYDIKRLVDVIAFPTKVIYGVNEDGIKAFYFLMESPDGTYNLMEVYADKKGNLTTKTYYKTRKGVSQRAISIENSLHSTSETTGATFSTAKVPQLFDISKFSDEKNKNSSEKAQFSISNAHNDIFYSNAERAVEGIKQEKATPEQWKAMIEKNGGLKAGEDKWIGLSDWLAQQRPTVTPQEGETRSQYIVRLGEESKRFTISKQDILDYIREHKIQIEEQEYGEYEEDALFLERKDEFKRYYDEAVEAGEEDPNEVAWDRMIEEYGDDFSLGYYAVGDELMRDNDSDYAQWEADSEGRPRNINETRLRYTTWGLENKREIALIVPDIEEWNEDDEIHFGDAGDGRAIAWVRFGDAHKIKYGENGEELADVLVIDEIQSKRHQEGREYGYMDSETAIKYRQLEKETSKAQLEYHDYRDQLWKKYENQVRTRGEMLDVLTPEEKSKHTELQEKYENLYDRWEEFKKNIPVSAIPAAPFEKNWHELAMKRILRFAAENGYDKVAWTTGEQQAKRYDIGKEIDHIVKTDENTYEVYPTSGLMMTLEFDENGMYADEYDREYNGKSMSDIFGKDLAKRLKEMPVDETLQGDGLRVGYDGMKGFYDDILPRFMQKYGKKWGVKVGEVTMPQLEDGYQTMHSVDITPEMRESVMEGQPMFMRTPKGVLYGWAVGNNIYLTKDGLNPRSPIHEYSHLWVESVKQHNSELYDNLKDLFSRENLPGMWKQLDKEEQYSDLSEDGKLSEIISRFSERGGKRMEEEAKRMMDDAKKKGKKAVANTASLIQRMKNALKRLWDWVGEHLFNIKNFGSREEAADRILYDMINKTDLQLDENPNRGAEFQIIGSKGATNLDRAEEATIRMDNLEVARLMEHQQKTPKEIRMATGWERGADGAWRYEIPDIKIKENVTINKDFDKTFRLPELVDAPELFAAYPEMKDYRVTYSHNIPIGIGGKFSKRNRLIYMNALTNIKERLAHQHKEEMEEIRKQLPAIDDLVEANRVLWNTDPNDKEAMDAALEQCKQVSDRLKDNPLWERYRKLDMDGMITEYAPSGDDVLSHEIQHAIQAIEGFSRGSNLEDMEMQSEYRRQSIAKLEQRIKDLEAQLPKPTEQWTEEHDAISKEIEDTERKILNLRNMNVQREAYNNAGGEVESRNVQNRMKLTPEERRERLLAETEDVAREDQVFLFHDSLLDADDATYSFNDEKQKIMADWHEQNPHPQYEEGEDLEHYRERLEAWKKAYDEMRGQTKGMQEEPKVEQPTSAETTAEPIQPEFLGPRELIRKFEAMNSVRMSPESVQARNRMIGNMRALRDQLHRLREAEASEVGAITGEIEQGVRDRQLALRAEYEKSAQMITDLAKDLFRGKVFLGMTDMDFSKMLTNIREASTKYDLQKNIEIMEDIVQRVQGRYLKASQNALNDAATIMTQRRNRVGVDIGRWVDPVHHVMISSFDRLRNTSVKHIDNVLADLNAQLNAETSETELDLLASKIAGAERARAYREQLDQLESDLTNLDLDIHQLDRYVERNNLRGNKRKEFMEQRRALMRERMDKMDELILLNDRTVDELSGITKDGRSDFIERIKKKQEHKIEVLRLASRDLAGIRDDKSADDKDKGGLKDMYLSPLRTFTHELRKFGTHSAGGEGYLYSYFAPLAHDARSNYLLHIRERMDVLDTKAKELFGEKATWDSVMKNVSNKLTEVEATWEPYNENERTVNSAGVQKTEKKKPIYLTNGQMMYIYMVNKMTDGKAKLGQMGITEDVVAELKAQLPKELVKLADWLQEEYFPMTRKRYNATNIFLYDTPMAEIPNYVPLKISGDAIEPQTDIQQGKVKLLPSNVVGSAISRTYNRKPIDIRNTDAMDLVVQNMMEMEHWSAYAELITDLNTLLNNLSFKNRIEQMNPNNYDNFYKTCQLVVEQYRPDVGPADALVAGLTRFIATSKISLRWWTAIKQRLSAISPLSEADPEFHKQYAKAYFHCKDNFQWAMENLPIFRERWESKQGGNEKLNIAEINSKSQKIQDMLEWAQENLVKYGISANAFVDAITCANMAKAQYETKKKYYTERGYSPEAVESLAKWKADEIYNETQQSSEGAYISAMQRDRTFVSSAISLFNNSSMAYTRKNAEALREIYKIAVGDKQAFIDFRKEQLMKDGMAEGQAAKFAETDYKRARTHAIADAAINGYIIQFVWNYGGKAFKTLLAVLPFLLMGDDDEKKKAKEELLKDLKKDAVVSTIQPVRGLPFGGTFDTSLGVVYDIATGQTERRYMSKIEVAGKIASNIHPSIDDISKLLSSLTRKEIDEMEFASYLVNIATASGTSIDAQTLANILWGLEDLTENTFEGKLTLADVRNDLSIILNAPPSQIEYMILQPHKGETKRQFIERYTEYIKLKKYGILTPFADDPELSADRKKKAADAFRKK